MMYLQAFLASFLLLGVLSSGTSDASLSDVASRVITPAISRSIPALPHDTILVLDVDNTLYSEERVRNQSGGGIRGIEEQVIENIHDFVVSSLGMTRQEADDLHDEYGSTIEGLRRQLLAQGASPDKVRELLVSFYHHVYDEIDMSSLTSIMFTQSSDSNHHQGVTGYSHSDHQQGLKDLLENLPYTVYLASNSPSWHVTKVLNALGLGQIKWKGVLTPDLIESKDIPYPTKAHPQIYYQEILKHAGRERRQVVLIDDSKHNIRQAETILGWKGVLVNTDNNVGSPLLESALARVMDHDMEADGSYSFSSVDYLRAKNQVDAQAINAETWQQMAMELKSLLQNDGELRIVDVGAGVLSMLELIVEGTETKPSLLELLGQHVKELHYFAYESNLDLYPACIETLERLGFSINVATKRSVPKVNQEIVVRHTAKNMILHLRMADFTDETIGNHDHKAPQLIMGCCFADLMQPLNLIRALYVFLGTWKKADCLSETLVYFPITFAGITQFVPPSPFELGSSSLISRRWVPSDTHAFRLYSDALTMNHGHNLDPDKLVGAFKSRGGVLIHRGTSNWYIDPAVNDYLWKTMLYFFGSVGAPEMMKKHWDSTGWISRAKRVQPTIVVTNVDLLFRLPLMDSKSSEDVVQEEEVSAKQGLITIEEILFTAPYEVTTQSRILDTQEGAHLGANQVEVHSICSLISSGTELKIFKGLFDDAALDVNIKGMNEERMAYSLSYGYSLVGKVVRCGPDVFDKKDLIGRLVFAFSTHASHVIADRDSLQLVPEGVAAEDAIFMPSVETALSIVHDAHCRMGEQVAVYGQGLIGLLVS